MDIIESIVHYFKNSNDKKSESSPDGTCPVCWGYQEYNGKIRKIFEDKQIDVNNHEASYMIIQDFMKHNIDGIILKEAEVSECGNCSDIKAS